MRAAILVTPPASCYVLTPSHVTPLTQVTPPLARPRSTTIRMPRPGHGPQRQLCCGLPGLPAAVTHLRASLAPPLPSDAWAQPISQRDRLLGIPQSGKVTPHARAAATRSQYVIELRPRPLLLRHLRPYATPWLRLSIGVHYRESFRFPVISPGHSRPTDSTSLLRAHVPPFNSGNSTA